MARRRRLHPTAGRAALLLASALLTAAAHSAAQDERWPPARPVEAVTAIVEAFRSHAVVALGEGPHGNEQGHAFRLSLIRDERFRAVVNDILVEFGSGRYQDLMDRYVQGEAVPHEMLRRVWQDTTVASAVWDRPIYEEFFRAVRELNLSLPPERRLRVLLGDAPIDWARVQSPANLRKWAMAKDRHSADVVKREVLAKGRRAFIVYGDGHLQGRGFPEGSLTNLLERPPHRTTVFAISSSFADLSRVQADVASWPAPSIARLQGTVIGARPYAFFYPIPPAKGWNVVKMEDQFDAVLYLGPPGRMTTSRLPLSLCFDRAYVEMRLRRLALDGGPVGNAGADWLKMYCAAQAPR